MRPIKPPRGSTWWTLSPREEVWRAFNFLIRDVFDGTESLVPLNRVVRHIARALGLAEKEVFSRELLANVEGDYRKAGWEVGYTPPAYSPSGLAFYTFRRKTGGDKE